MKARPLGRSAAVALVCFGLSAAPAPCATGSERALDQIEAALEAGRAEEALQSLEQFESPDRPIAARALLLRSTALFMLGRIEPGRRDLEEALAKDPNLRQAWLNRAALDIADGDLDRALEALGRARALDPQAADTDLNIGAVLLMQGKVAEAAPYLERYLAAAGDTAGSHATFRTYETPYLAGEGKLLPAVLDALQLSGEPFDRQIEVTPEWALIWGEMRIKVRNDADGHGRIELTAPGDRFGDAEWRARAAKLLSEIAVQIAKR